MRQLLRWTALIILCLGVTPLVAGAQVEVLSPSIVENSATPGARYVATIVLRNAAASPQAVRVYQEDYLFFADGRSLFGRAAVHSRSNADWIEMPSAQMVLAPGQMRELAFPVRVPNDSLSRVGSYWSLILIEPSALPSVETRTAEMVRATGMSAVVTRVRQAIQVVTHIAETGRQDVRIGEPRLTTTGGRREVRVEIENTGERAYRPHVSLEVLAASGRVVLTHKQARGLVYPGTSIDQVFDLTTLAPDDYALLLVVDTGSTDMFGARYRLRLQ